MESTSLQGDTRVVECTSLFHPTFQSNRPIPAGNWVNVSLFQGGKPGAFCSVTPFGKVAKRPALLKQVQFRFAPLFSKPPRYISRNFLRSTLPMLFLGSASTNRISFGTL